MLLTLEKIFATKTIEGPGGKVAEMHSNTSREQGLFLQQIFDKIKPRKSIEVGFAYGISSMFILEKHREAGNDPKCHLIIEPFPWGGVAEYNIEKEKLTEFADIRYDLSDKILPGLYLQNHRIQFAYIDTTKVFDTVLQDFYFIDKMLDVNGVVIFDDCGAGCPGVQRVARFVNSLPHYKLYAKHNKAKESLKRRAARVVVSKMIEAIPFKDAVYPTIDFRTDEALGIDSSCIVFQKVSIDQRTWDWDAKF